MKDLNHHLEAKAPAPRYEALEQLDLSPMLARLKEETGADDKILARAEDLYKKYLQLHLMFPDEKFPPPKLADYVWHQHILHTKKYREDCEEIFGEFFDHTPSSTAAQGWETTKAKYLEVFGVDLETVSWD